MALIFDTPAGLLGREGTQLGPTPSVLVDQARINIFADATLDHQWIHVDTERAADGPFGATIAHGFLTVSLAAYFLSKLVEVHGLRMGVNVGVDRLRFLSPVKVGSRLSATGEIIKVEQIRDAIQSTVRITITAEGSEKPACVLDKISRYYPA